LANYFFKFHAGVKKCHFGYFSERAGMLCLVSGPQQSLTGIEKFIFVLDAN
jgi:hypothetical protein